MNKLSRIIALMLVFTLLLAGCGKKEAVQSNDNTNGEETLNITFVTPVIAHPVWLVAKKGFEEAGTEFNFNASWVGPSTIDTNAMISQIEIAIAEKVDGIITMGMNPEAMVPVMKQAEEAGIPVVVVNSDIPNAKRLAYLGTDPQNLGYMGAEAIANKMEGTPIKSAIMVSALDYKVGNDMADSYIARLEQEEGFEMVIKEASNTDMLTAVQKWENIFSTYPDINVAINISGESAAACAKVVKEMGLTEQVLIMGIDDIQETVDGIAEGNIYGTMTQNFYRKGYQASQWLCEFIREGKEPAEVVNDSGTLLVTEENVDTYKSDMEKPETWK